MSTYGQFCPVAKAAEIFAERWTPLILRERRLRVDRLPARRVVVQVDFRGARNGSYWLVLEPRAPSVCWEPPGFDVDLVVAADTLALHRVRLGHQTLSDALARGEVALNGPRELTRAFPDWLALSPMAGVRRSPGSAARPS